LLYRRRKKSGLSFYPWRHAEFSSRTKVDSIIITGRSYYLISNEDVNETFASLHNITNDGVIIFDFIDANRFIPMQMKTLLSFIKQYMKELAI
jgi:hypothetical protein